MQFITHSPEETEKIEARLAEIEEEEQTCATDHFK